MSGPSGIRPIRCSTSAPTPAWVRAEIGKISPSGSSSPACWSTSTVAARPSLSTLLTAIAIGSPARASVPAMNLSPGPTPCSPLRINSAASAPSSSRATLPAMRVVSASRGRCTPGRSTSTICPSSRVHTPRIALRVVCGRSETIATLAPTITLTSVDLPTFGRPAKATKPLRVMDRPPTKKPSENSPTLPQRPVADDLASLGVDTKNLFQNRRCGRGVHGPSWATREGEPHAGCTCEPSRGDPAPSPGTHPDVPIFLKGVLSVIGRPLEQLRLQRQHLAVIGLVIHAHQVQHAVHDRLAQIGRVLGTDQHVTQLARSRGQSLSSFCPLASPASRPSFVGAPPRSAIRTVDRKRQDVRWLVAVAILAVEPCDRRGL